MGKSGIPDRWLPYSPMGSVVPGTCFIACKVPLKDALLRKLPENERFGPRELMKSFPKIGLLIDLTNTTRYYMKEEFTTEGIVYKKIFCPGHVIPPNSIVKEFNFAVDTFLREYKETDMLIAVHCTHGVNRTGYFICRYMIEKMNIRPEDAVKWFQQARGHNIERQPYVDDLKNGCKGGSESNCSFKIVNQKKGRIERKQFMKHPYNKTSYMEEGSTEYNGWRDRNYPSTKKYKRNLNLKQIEENPIISSIGTNNYNHKASISRPNVSRSAWYKERRPWHQNCQAPYDEMELLNHNGSWPLNSHHHIDSDRSSYVNVRPGRRKLKSHKSKPDETKPNSFDTFEEPKSFIPIEDANTSAPLNSCLGYETSKNNSEDYNKGISTNYWKITDFRHHTNRPQHHPGSFFDVPRPPVNSFCIRRPPSHQALPRMTPPTSNRHPNQSQNRVWLRPSQPSSGLISQPQNTSQS